MFDHVRVRVSDRGESERFYAVVLAALDVPPTRSDDELAVWNGFSLCPATRACPPTKRLHVAFGASSPERVDAFWQSGTEAGFLDDGRPGPRPRYRDDYYGGFLRDPDGNSVEAVHHGDVRPGRIDHLWVRVSDLQASRRFYDVAAPHAGLRLVDAQQQRVRFAGDGGSMSLVTGPATEGLHIAFAASDDAAVEAFHSAATAAGYTDHGAPAERPQYHGRSYAAYVLDPDGTNVELVNHHRG
ncbi:MAG TPA: VOC family protein [Gaiellales bacterium]|nr:VOC family protein [Gaiellales bacterium]